MNTSYNFRALSPKDFEDLIGDILAEKYGCHFESFRSGADGGIDLRGRPSECMRIIGQAKHYIGSTFSDLKRACVNEAKRKDEVAKNFQRYILATTQPLSPRQKSELLKIFDGFPLTEENIWGSDDVASLIRRYPSIERAHFKLWMTGTATLERLLYGRLYDQSEGEAETIETELCRFVRHRGVDQAYQILRKHGVLFISGPPGIGKTTLARMICALHMTEEWDFTVAHTVEEVGDAFSLGGQRIVLFDDFLGQVRLSDYLLHQVDSRLPPQILRAIKSENLRLIVTTRDYILGSAQSRSERLVRSIADEDTYILSLNRYSYLDRARILYNHLYFSNLEPEQIEAFIQNGFYKTVVEHPNYNPRIIQTVTDAEYTRLTSQEIQQQIKGILDKPELLWSTPYREHISDASQLLAITVTIGSWRRHPGMSTKQARESFAKLNIRLGFGLKAHRVNAKFNGALKQLEGNFLSITDQCLFLSNPGVRGFLESAIIDDGWFELLLESANSLSELEYLRNLSPDKVIENKTKWVDAYERLYGDDATLMLTEFGRIVEAVRFVDENLLSENNQHFVAEAAQAYLKQEEHHGELDEFEHILSAIDFGLFSSDVDEAILRKVECELEQFFEDDRSSVLSKITIDDVDWLAPKFYEYDCLTDGIKNTLSNIIETALDNDSSNLDEMNDEDIERLKETVEELESLMNADELYNSSYYSERYTNKLEERSYRDEMMYEMHRDGYYERSRANSTTSNKGVSNSSQSIERPLDDSQIASSMFESLRSKN